MTKKQLLKTHPDYDANIDSWVFFLHSYFGGNLYRSGGYLVRHPFESAANYERRKRISYYYNYCGPIVDIFVSHLFRRKAVRDFGSLTGDPLFERFLRNADLEGSSFAQFMRDAQRFASIYGRVSIVVDKPPLEAATMAEAVERDLRPYVTLVTPENLLDWSYVREPTGRTVLDAVKIREGRDLYRIWSRGGWELWRLEAKSSDAVLVDAGEHPLGEVPVVNLYNKRSGTAMVGVSDLQDIADINKNIYYLCSDAKEIIENTAFPMLAVPYGPGVDEQEVGPRNILGFDPSEPNSRPYWLEPPHSSLTEIREWVRQDINEIHRIAKMGGVKATEDFGGVRSGVALELEHQQLHALLSEKADNTEHAESSLLELWARWQGVSFDGRIDYPDDFSVRDLDRDLDVAIKARSAAVASETFNREIEKKIVRAALPKLDESVMKTIVAEIDGGDGKTRSEK
ncbi:MAG TPA: phage portal protein [Deltaproteobacteria bacterium]|nr:phage portal protein [Deltaproteobacteria bacterium]